ncbi:MAG: diacylglycerol kinase family lipid kinase [Lachnospiraceae bacterium]|jgi:YegS/Rv2252/BmrU family lipid kinase|uniref:diacylglycerol/lipid kinase family protein n=1 Tax=Clostridium sp. (strain SY8519) TaxID=1042156 RepID=UPI0002F42FB5|nr:diacylglycerol kinase family protein [Clostridium sp. SY8519]MCI1653882.1 diacylglycerol kinase family lipid kinase [Lachnospiraceae bacterium]MCI1656206.1 diacylglycerol kinase family lipid kinase [Lachnospiraceae bacterium]MCI2194688.1 diacylglycerol kinase family lipid kinase [Lachnospiraceae bacterium]HAD19029.1 diacylglycerol kinase family lipid kinase [Lachnospiraceae bacterium]
MSKKKLIFMYNPKSGKGLIRNYLYDIIDTFVKADYEVTVYPTQCVGDALRRVPETAPDYDLLVCSGGDGTLDECVTGMMNSKVNIPIGYIPAGSTNDYAQSLNIPKNMLKAAELAVTGRAYPCDVGAFNGDHFVYVAAFGLFSDVSYQTNQNLKNVLGHGAYLLEGAKRLYDIPSYHLQAEINGEQIEDDFVYGMVSNSVSVGGMKGMTGTDIRLDDGLFEVTLIRMPQNPLQLNDILATLLLPFDKRSQYIVSCKAAHLTIRSDDYVPWTLDGEFGGNHKYVAIHCQKQAVRIVASPAQEVLTGESSAEEGTGE